jgi:glycosyltransferase involved in cell wall biosynthesis
VAVLLATHQGETFLAEQLDSIAQSYGVDWVVWASDDDSRDRTGEILSRYRREWGDERLTILQGPSRGVAANFLSLVVRDDVRGDAYAFADQDDVWEPGKLMAATEWLMTLPADVPALYCSRTTLVDREGRTLGLSPLFRRPPSFANALTQNIASGNTMVFNEATRRLLGATAREAAGSAMHDWWAYLIVTGVGGRVRYDSEPRVRYRQHGNNQIGANAGTFARASTAQQLLGGQFARWNDQNEHALRAVGRRLTSENLATFEAYAAARHAGFRARLSGLRQSGVYRQTLRGQVFLWSAALLNRL